AVPNILAALSDMDIEIVVTAKRADLELLGAVPTNTRPVERLPLGALLPSCDAIVHQGGAGTTMTAAYHGVPQLAGGVLGDQEVNAARLVEVGAGIALPAASASADEIAGAVSRLLADSDVRRGADTLRGEILEHRPPNEVADQLRALAR